MPFPSVGSVWPTEKMCEHVRPVVPALFKTNWHLWALRVSSSYSVQMFQMMPATYFTMTVGHLMTAALGIDGLDLVFPISSFTHWIYLDISIFLAFSSRIPCNCGIPGHLQLSCLLYSNLIPSVLIPVFIINCLHLSNPYVFTVNLCKVAMSPLICLLCNLKLQTLKKKK